MTRGRQERIQCQPKPMFNNSRDDPLEKWTVDFKARVSIALDKVGLELAADIEIEAIELKIMCFSAAIDKHEAGLDHVDSDVLHLFEDAVLEVIVLMRIVIIEISLKLTVTNFIGRLVFPIFLTFLLNCVICQVNEFI